ncbi:MAG: DMT family transporter [Patescibacteria group bacterium]|jgi:drug/metabolite transporter (DMT)-like permease
MSNQRKKAYLALLTTSLIWGVASPVIKYTLNFVSPYTFLFYRFLIVSLLLIIPLTIKLRKIKLTLKNCFLYVALGFIGTPLTLLLLFSGMKRTAAVNASIISLFTPVVIVIGGVLFLNEKVTRNEKKGILLILLGAFLSIIEPLFQSGINFSQGVLGNLLVFANTFSWAGFSLLRRKFGEKLDSLVLTASSFIVGLIVLLPILANNPSGFTLNQNAIPGILYMSILGSVIAYFTYIYGFSKIEASEATLFTYLEPVFAIPVSIMFLKEKVSFLFIIGAVLILSGIVVSELKIKAKSRLRAAS